MTLLEATVLDWKAIIAALGLMFTMIVAFATFVIRTNVKIAEINKDIAEIKSGNITRKMDVEKEIKSIQDSNKEYLNEILKLFNKYLEDNKEEHKELTREIKGLNTNINELKISLASKRRNLTQ